MIGPPAPGGRILQHSGHRKTFGPGRVLAVADRRAGALGLGVGTGARLITISLAADLSGKSVKSISQFVARGKLSAYPDLTEPNPRRCMRVLKSEVQHD